MLELIRRPKPPVLCVKTVATRAVLTTVARYAKTAAYRVPGKTPSLAATDHRCQSSHRHHT
ncbi:hypothetical protein GN244_ATG02684 [Phytophthora infestans]|uniref:Uncharacterized protein n=1 Tax=Phytophthora infestans TaxID=4787 RepID=A0A833WLT9_PHYIN|nr:hypothetical protein GN244_ATG02684 [Phytophthora infestans]KAF4138881.1 hypothetical protein GN958_ATG11838 [Phytophthora infestans]